MKKRKKFKEEDDFQDDDMPIGKLTEVPDFLPPPHELAKARTLVTITIALDLETLKFFQKQAQKHGSKYQRMIREVLNRYVKHYNDAA